MPPLCFSPQHLVVVLSLVGPVTVLLEEDTSPGSDPPVMACHSFLELDDQ